MANTTQDKSQQVSDDKEPLAFYNNEETSEEESSGEESGEEQGTEEVTEGTPDSSPDDMPAKFKGKSTQDIIKAYTELEKTLGRQGQELGELRRATAEYLASDLEAKRSANKNEKVDPEKFYENGPEYVDKLVDSKLKTVEERLGMVNAAQALSEFKNRHPDHLTVGQSEGFREWVSSKPHRMDKFIKADNGDVTLADELLTDYKDFVAAQESNKKANASKEIQAEQAANRKSTLKRMSGESGKAPTSGKKILKATDLIRLHKNDPDRYESMAEEILQAYQEGRVK